MLRLTVIGNPDNRRVGLFRAAAVSAGLSDPVVVSWRSLLDGPSARRSSPAGSVAGLAIASALVRIDSPGEDAEVDRLLRGTAEPARPGEIVGLAAWYRGFARVLSHIAAHPGLRFTQDPGEILVMFDKRACHARLMAAGIPVPAALPSVEGYDSLRSHMAAAGWTRVFVKPAHGSSASGVIALRVAGGRVAATTSVEVEGKRLYNSLRVREYRDEHTVRSIVDALAPDRLHVERWYPKAALDGRVLDLRVVVIGGRPTHVVVRTSRGPMTNLHLGGLRGDLTRVVAAASSVEPRGPTASRLPTAYEAAMQTCVRVAECFPRSLHVGVDLMFSPDWRNHAVAEVNAFGDLLPGLLANGRDTYAEQIRVLMERQPAGVVAPGAVESAA